jgi:predicted nucleotidyltransferase
MAPLRVSISGPDNTGKTTQIRLLTRALGERCFSSGGIDLYSNAFPNLPPEEFSRWWFSSCPTSEFTRIIFEAVAARNAVVSSHGCPVALLDRGLQMFEAVSIATAMIKDHCGYETAAERVRAIRNDVIKGDDEDLNIILLHDEDLDRSVNLTLTRAEREVDDTYRKYQYALQEALFRQCQEHKYDVVVTCADKSIVEIQNELRLHLQGKGVSVNLLCEHVEKVYGFGGMSESGKSTAADYLRMRYGVTRLKIIYLLEVAAKVNGINDIYAQPEHLVAELMLEELDRLARRQYYLKEYSVESLHGVEITKHLKNLLGGKFVIAYCEAEQKHRILRSSGTADQIGEKDGIKMSRGGGRVKSIADFILNNNHDLTSLHTQLDFLYNTSSVSGFVPLRNDLHSLHAPESLLSISSAVLSALKEKLGTKLKLFAVVGSVGIQKARDTWSDLDILIVVTPHSMPLLRQVMHDLQATFTVKVGLTVVTPAEVQYRRVEAKVLHMIYLMRQSRLQVQYLAPDYALPDFPVREDINSSMRHLPTFLHALRREIVAPQPSVRHLYKRIILCAKIMLLANGMFLEDEDDIVRSLYQVYPATTLIDIPQLDSVVTGQVTPADMVMKAIEFLNWYETITNSFGF